jgi:uncharacterized protein (DUF58 family)
MFRRPQVTISREGWYYIFVTALVFFGAAVKEVNLLLLLSGMMLGLLIFHGRALFISLRGLTLQRKAPQAVCAGDLLAVSLCLHNARPRFGAWAVTVEEQIERESVPLRPHRNHNQHHNSYYNDKPIHASVFFPYVPAGQQRIGTYRGQLIRRGRYQLGPLRISTRFPFGLFCRRITVGQTETLYVYPRLGRLTRRWLARRRQALAGADRRQRRPGPEGDFYGVREWRSGDSLRLIHWRTSARAGKFVVRQFEQPHNRDVAVLMDLWLPDQASTAELDNIELAISFAATVLADSSRQGGGKVHLGVYDQQLRCLGGPASAALLQDLMMILAVVEPPSEDHLPALIEHMLGNIASGTEIILISTRPVDLFDSRRFAAIWSDPTHSAAVRNIRCIDASSTELEEFFIAE